MLAYLRPVTRRALVPYWYQAARNKSTSAAAAPQPRVIFSGIQPTGVPHLGNIFGALQNWVDLQKNAAPNDELIFSIVGWHSLTLPQDPRQLSKARQEMLAALLAMGIDPNRSIIFHQDDNPHHTELAWLLSCLTPMGKLNRMTTWKSRLAASRNAQDESEIDESMLNAGLFTYPVLQAADILAYKATHVPVGEDQKQHLELARDIADIFNRRYKRIFPLPEYVATSTCRVLSLRDPTSKMSKSSPDLASRVNLTDTDLEVRVKMKAAVTDSIVGVTYDPVNRPGVANLLTILGACTRRHPAQIAKGYTGKNNAHLKADAMYAVMAFMKNLREEFLRIREEKAYLAEVAKEGAAKARERSEVTMREVRKLVGLV